MIARVSFRLESTRRASGALSVGPSGLLWAGALAALVLTGGCKRKTEGDASAAPYVLTDQTSDIEEQNLRAVCQAAAQVLEEGAPDRTTRLAELALPASADASLIDGLRATDPPKRMGVVRALIKKYGLAVECQPSLPAFERGPPRPEDLPPEAAAGQTDGGVPAAGADPGLGSNPGPGTGPGLGTEPGPRTSTEPSGAPNGGSSAAPAPGAAVGVPPASPQ